MLECISVCDVFSVVGFAHSAFSLGYEAGINKCPLDGNLVPPGALITLVQKGLQYLEMEANMSIVSEKLVRPFFLVLFIVLYVVLMLMILLMWQSDADIDEDFSFIQPIDLITKDVNELRRMVREKRRSSRKDREKESEKEHRDRKRGRDGRGIDREKDNVKDGEGKEKDAKAGREKIEKSGREKDERIGKEKDERVGIEKDERTVREKEEKAGKEKEEKFGKEREEKAGREKEEKARKERDEKISKDREEKTGREKEEKVGKEREEKISKERDEKISKEREEKAGKERDDKNGKEKEDKAGKERQDKIQLQDGPVDKETGVQQEEKSVLKNEDNRVCPGILSMSLVLCFYVESVSALLVFPLNLYFYGYGCERAYLFFLRQNSFECALSLICLFIFLFVFHMVLM